LLFLNDPCCPAPLQDERPRAASGWSALSEAAEIKRLRQAKFFGSRLQVAQQIAPLKRFAIPGAEDEVIRSMEFRTVPRTVKGPVDLTAAVERHVLIAGLGLHVKRLRVSSGLLSLVQKKPIRLMELRPIPRCVHDSISQSAPTSPRTQRQQGYQRPRCLVRPPPHR
jgi:hypothetical protein